jgi:hypothetical protein
MNKDKRVIYNNIILSLLSLLKVGSTSYKDKNAEAIVKQVALNEVDR